MPDTNSVGVERLKSRLKMRVMDLLEGQDATQARSRRADIESALRQALSGELIDFRMDRMNAEQQTQLVREVMEEMIGYGPLDQYLADPDISEIMINGPKEIFIEKNGQITRAPEQFKNAEHLHMVIERMLSLVGRTVTESEPICDASLPTGERLNVIIPPLVLNGPVVTIRRKLRDWTMEEWMAREALDPRLAEFLIACVQSKVNFIISGGTSTAKTTLVAILSAYLPSDDRVITIENVPELELLNRKHWIRMVGRSSNLEGRGEIPLRALVKNALRMRPDRIILGEARGGEALDVVQAMHSGHDGFITVLHANTARAALERLQTLMLMSGLDIPPSACRVQIASAVDLVVHLERFLDGSRRISAVTQVMGSTPDGFDLEEIFAFEPKGFTADGKLQGSWRYTGAKPKFASKFRLNNVGIPTWMKA